MAYGSRGGDIVHHDREGTVTEREVGLTISKQSDPISALSLSREKEQETRASPMNSKSTPNDILPSARLYCLEVS